MAKVTSGAESVESAVAIGTALMDRQTGSISWSAELQRELQLPAEIPAADDPDAAGDYLTFDRSADGSTMTFGVPTASGETRRLQLEALSLPPELDGQYRLWAAFDLTRYHDSLARLEHHESLLLHSQQVANLGCWSFTLPEQRLEWSDHLYVITGVDRDADVSVELFHSLLHPDDRDWVIDGSEAALQTGETPPREFRILRASDGAERWVLEWCNPVLNADGEPTMFVGTLQDITERRELEMQLLQSQKMDAIGRLAGGIAHDFNNMLTVIQGYLELLQLEGDREEYRRIGQATRQAAELTGKLLSFSRHVVHRRETVDLHTIVEQAMNLVSRIIGEDITLRADLCDQPCWIEADTSALEQMIMNLLVNARDAMPQGGHLTLSTRHETVSRMATPSRRAFDGTFVRLDVADTGCGMDHETRSRVFEPFFTTKATGTGLGLATVFGGITQIGGFVELETAPGHGCTFSLYVPLAREPDVRPAAPAPRVEHRSDHVGLILVVEDEAAIRTLLDAALSRSGYSVILASRPQEAIAIWRERSHEIDLIVSDMVMPDMSGLALISQLRETRPTVPVILMTGYAPDPDSAPADATILLKPFSPQTLVTTIRTTLA